jgi:hypothetical protein
VENINNAERQADMGIGLPFGVVSKSIVIRGAENTRAVGINCAAYNS